MIDPLAAHVPGDRLRALRERRDLPTQAEGMALFADIAGFTPLTARLMRDMGPRRGAEELTQLLDQVYEVLVNVVHAWGGSVIGFSGDALTAWFPGPDPAPAVACGLALQAAMQPFAACTLPLGAAGHAQANLALKVAVTSGAVDRFIVGDPAIQLIDVLAGEPILRLAAVEHLARPGEVLVEEALAARLGGALTVTAWRGGHLHATAPHEPSAAVVAALAGAPEPADAPPGADSADPSPADLEAWVAPTVLARLRSHGEFMTELRPVNALFLIFVGPDYSSIAAQATLDRYIRWVQRVLARYNATLIQLTVGDKGSYLYAAFGAPIAHEDDSRRAAEAALTLRESPEAAIGMVRIGIAQGIARTGLYGGSARRTYGVLGDAVNLAARLMQQAAPGQILANEPVRRSTEDHFAWGPETALHLKGQPRLTPASLLLGHRLKPAAPNLANRTTPMIGRQDERVRINALLGAARSGAGRIAVLGGDAGIGKSRLALAACQDAEPARILRGATQSYGTASPYLCWYPIWQAVFDCDPAAGAAQNLPRVRAALARWDAEHMDRLPLLGSALNLAIPDSALTATLDPQLRKQWLEDVLVRCFAAFVRAECPSRNAPGGNQQHSRRIVVVLIEDAHWIDQLSAALLQRLASAIAALPVALVLTTRQPNAAPVAALPGAETIILDELGPKDIGALLAAKLHQRVLAGGTRIERLATQISARAQGNPFYLEELANYLSATAFSEEQRDREPELPTGLHRLVLSRVDRLAPRQQGVLKAASILGGSFRDHWLWEYHPGLGDAAQIQESLAILREADLLAPGAEPDLWRFKHAITQEVTYESLARSTRRQFHEQFARYLERTLSGDDERIDLLAHHYAHSADDGKAVQYLARSGARAARLFANEAAVRQYESAITRAASTAAPPLSVAELERSLGDVHAQIAAFDAALRHFDRSLAAMPAGAVVGRAQIGVRQSDVLVRAGRFEEAMALVAATEDSLDIIPASAEARLVRARLAELRSTRAIRQSDAGQAITWAEQGLRHLERLPNHQADVAATRARLYHALATAASWGYDTARARDVLDRGLRLVRRYPQPAIEGELRLRSAILALNDVYPQIAVRLFQQARPAIEKTGARDRLANLLLPGGQALALAGNFSKALEWLREGLALGKETGSTYLIAAGLSTLTWLTTAVGDWGAALGYTREGKELARRNDLRSHLAIFLGAEGLIDMFQGRHDQAERLFDELGDYAQRHQLAASSLAAERNQAYNAFLQNRFDAIRAIEKRDLASPPIRTSAQALDAIGTGEWWAVLRANGIGAQYAMEEIAPLVGASLAFFRARGCKFYYPNAYRVNAMLAWQRGDLGAALADIQRGLRIARRIDHRLGLARCLFWQGKLRFELGHAAELGAGDLREAAALFASMGARPEEERARALLLRPRDRSIVL